MGESPTGTAPFKFRGGDGRWLHIHRDLRFQPQARADAITCLPLAAASAAGRHRIPAASRGELAGGGEWFALKQKLDCALQLARTVSLDFNNALTSILGHTSLSLSKMEAGHPWRHSLIEVEKSAAKAAEIANDLGRVQPPGKGSPRAAGNLNLLLTHAWSFPQRGAGKSPGRCSWSGSCSRQI